MVSYKLIVAAAICLSSSEIAADSIVAPSPRVFSSGRFVFTMNPGERLRKKSGRVFDGNGVCYRLEDDGTLSKVWSTEGWYAYQVYLSGGGRYLVRMGPWNSGSRPSPDDLALAFYKDGKLLKRYSTSDLIVRPMMLRVTVSHYDWLADHKHPSPELVGNELRLRTSDQIEYVFDATTGDVKSKHDEIGELFEKARKAEEEDQKGEQGD